MISNFRQHLHGDVLLIRQNQIEKVFFSRRLSHYLAQVASGAHFLEFPTFWRIAIRMAEPRLVVTVFFYTGTAHACQKGAINEKGLMNPAPTSTKTSMGACKGHGGSSINAASRLYWPQHTQ